MSYRGVTIISLRRNNLPVLLIIKTPMIDNNQARGCDAVVKLIEFLVK